MLFAPRRRLESTDCVEKLDFSRRSQFKRPCLIVTIACADEARRVKSKFSRPVNLRVFPHNRRKAVIRPAVVALALDSDRRSLFIKKHTQLDVMIGHGAVFSQWTVRRAMFEPTTSGLTKKEREAPLIREQPRAFP
jgi:hypothetical protein